jgi:hypothetical protein
MLTLFLSLSLSLSALSVAGPDASPLGQIALNSQILFKLKKESSYVFIILYHAENKPIIHTASSKDDISHNAKTLDDLKNFVMRLHEKDEANLKHWIFALQAAVMLGTYIFLSFLFFFFFLLLLSSWN